MKLNINYQNNLEKMNKISRYEIQKAIAIGTHTDFVKIPYLLTLPGRYFANFTIRQFPRKATFEEMKSAKFCLAWVAERPSNADGYPVT